MASAQEVVVTMREYVLIALFVLSFPLVAYVSTLPAQRFRNEITEWGDQSSQAYIDFDDYRDKFGANEWVVLSWPGCDLFDPRMEEVTLKIEAQLAGSVQQVSNGLRLVRDLQSRAQLSKEEAIKRLRNIFLSKSDFGTAIGFHISESARNNRGEVMDKLDSILKSSGVDPQSAIFAGLAHNLYSLDKEGLESPFRMVPQIMLLAIVLTTIFVRNFWLAFFINALGTYTGCLSFNFIYLADIDLNAITWPLPTLTLLLTVSASLHFLSYFKKAVESTSRELYGSGDDGQQYRRRVARLALLLSFRPMLCCNVTTMVGLLSLLLSTSQPVRQFGLFGAISITTAGILVLILLPAFLTIIGYAEKLEATAKDYSRTSPQTDRWSWLANFTHTFRWPIVVTCTLLLVVCAFGVPRIKTGSNLQNFFPAGHPVLEQATEIEEKIGPLGSIELLLHFKNAEAANDRLRIKGLEALSSRIIKQTDIQSCLSGATFAPELKRRRANAIQQAVQMTILERLKKAVIEFGLLYVEPQVPNETGGDETWRISCRFSLSRPIDVPKVSQQLKSIAEDLFTRDGKVILKGEQLEVSTTGEFVLFDNVDRQFFRELMMTYLTAFGGITLVVLIVLRSVRTSLIALPPNLFPAVVVLGTAGFFTRSLDVASLMTASVALGIAIDDTLHFLSSLRARMLWNPKDEASVALQGNDLIIQKMRYCGQAMSQTSMILGLSIVLYAFCGFLPTVRFGILMSAMMFAALIGDLLFLPALMSCFGKRS